MPSKTSKQEKPYRIARGILDFDVYGYRVTFVFTNDLQRARDEYDSVIGHHLEHAGAGAFHSTVDWATDPRSFLFFPLDACSEYIAHESAHVIFRMFRWAGIEFNERETGENFAYHLGHLVANITSAQRKLVPERFRRIYVKRRKAKRAVL